MLRILAPIALTFLGAVSLLADPPLLRFTGGHVKNAVVKDGQIYSGKQSLSWSRDKDGSVKIGRGDYLQFDNAGAVRVEKNPETPSRWKLTPQKQWSENIDWKKEDSKGTRQFLSFAVSGPDGKYLAFVDGKLCLTETDSPPGLFVEVVTEIDWYSGK